MTHQRYLSKSFERTFRTRNPELKTKNLKIPKTRSLTSSNNLNPEPLGPCNSELLLKSSRSHMFFEIGSFKNFAIFTRKHLCWGFQTCNWKTPKQVFRVDIAKFLITAFYIEDFRWLPLAVLPQYSKVSWGICSLISRLHMLSKHETLHR